MPRDCVLDFETRSTQKLGKGGTNAYCYADHPTTDVWMACYVMVDNPDDVRTWWPGQPMPDDLRQLVEDGGRIIAHNAAFEHAIWNHLLVPRYGWPALPLRQMDDTAARAARCGLPRSLEQAAPAAGIPIAKDKAGAELMKRMARPRKVHGPVPGDNGWYNWLDRAKADPRTFTLEDTPHGVQALEWWATSEKVERLHAYCRQDVRVQLQLHQTLPELPEREHAIWLTTMRANARGLQLDRAFIGAAQAVVDEKLAGYAMELRHLTHGRVKSHSDLNGMKAYLADQGHPVDSLDKNVVAALKDDPHLPANVRRVVSIRAEAGKSSVAKYPAMLLHADAQGIARDQLVYYGAQATGRWSGMGIQVQNLPARGEVGFLDAEWWIERLRVSARPGEYIALMEALHDGSAVATLSMCLRGAIQARDGKVIVCADYANIEGRFNAWMAGEAWKLQAFRDYDSGEGPDLYKVTAALILGKSPDQVTKTERNVLGKVPELALGYQGGAGAFADMGATYGIDMEDYADTVRASLPPDYLEQAEENYAQFGYKSSLSKRAWLTAEAIKLAWRERHPEICQAWRDTEDAAVAAIRTPGQAFYVADGRLGLLCRTMFGKPFLLMRLPSGRCIHFANVALRDQKTPWGTVKPQIWYDKVENGRIKRSATYGGDIWQSAIQGGARDIMANGWLNAEAAGYDGLFSVHDELAAEADPERADLCQFETLLCQVEPWAAGCPVTAKGYVAPRFRKD